MKIDLSEKNVRKTIMHDDLLAQNLKTNKKYIGVFITDVDCKSIKIIPQRYTLNEFKKEFKDRRIISTHEYPEYLSVAIERLVS